VTGLFLGPTGVFSRTTRKIMSLFGMTTFLAIMVYESNLITKLAKQGENNDWRSAFEFAHELYLAFINLVFQMLQYLGASGGG
jgi:FtsH-binding integral membrane protein